LGNVSLSQQADCISWFAKQPTRRSLKLGCMVVALPRQVLQARHNAAAAAAAAHAAIKAEPLIINSPDDAGQAPAEQTVDNVPAGTVGTNTVAAAAAAAVAGVAGLQQVASGANINPASIQQVGEIAIVSC
jgi:hypothetical protein